MNSAAADLDTLKADLPALLSVLGLERPGNHGRCIFCQSRDAMSVYRGEAGWRFRCHACNATGSLVDAIMLIEGCSLSEALHRLDTATTTPRPRPLTPPPAAPLVPVPDENRLCEYQSRCILALYEGHPLAVRYAAKRGISIDAALRFCVGFDVAKRCWTFPIDDGTRRVVALKLHREDPPEGLAKSGWAAFGTQPPEKPRHGLATLFPIPEAFLPDETLFICEGELKALAIISAGRAAIAPTAGAGFSWKPWHVARLTGRRVCVVFDDDDAGHAFRDHTTTALRGAAADLRTFTFQKDEVAA